jgi:antitoxin ParD1/3/4
MNVSLTPELESFVQQKLSSGMYHSASEIVREGLRLLKEQDALKELRLLELRKEIQRGVDSGPAQALDMEAIIAEAKADFERERQA